MEGLRRRFKVIPFLVMGVGLFLIGLLSVNHIINSLWPIDVARLDLVRDTALYEAEVTQLLQASNAEIILAFLAAEAVAVTGLTLPLAYYLNKRFGHAPSQHFFVVLRQSMWVGLWVAACTWLQMNRSLSWGVAILVATVPATVEILLQIRARTDEIASQPES
jgi:hypothetical protein